MPLRATTAVLVLFGWAAAPAPALAAEPPPLVERYLLEGRLKEGEDALVAHLAKRPRDAQARFGLGALQFFQALEHLFQGLHRYGLKPRTGFLGQDLPFLRQPVGDNPKPEPVSPAKLDRLFKTLLADLEKSRHTLEQVPEGEVKLPLHVFAVHLDFNGDGKIAPEESLARVMTRMFGGVAPQNVVHGGTVVCFDAADVHWLRGYCHLLSALAEVILAHDWTEVVDNCGHLFFDKVDGQPAFLRDGPHVFPYSDVDVVDLVALVHLLRMPLRDRAGMRRALDHLEAMIAESRVMWRLILAETDDDNEWIPGPKQKSALSGLRVSQEMVDGWVAFLDEAEALFKGKKLVPFWRGADRGLNLRRVFTDPPRTFDLVLWVQGTAAVPYLEKGELTRPETWGRFQQVFRGNFLGFAVWFN